MEFFQSMQTSGSPFDPFFRQKSMEDGQNKNSLNLIHADFEEIEKIS
jgi:hypothetical protein